MERGEHSCLLKDVDKTLAKLFLKNNDILVLAFHSLPAVAAHYHRQVEESCKTRVPICMLAKDTIKRSPAERLVKTSLL